MKKAPSFQSLSKPLLLLPFFLYCSMLSFAQTPSTDSLQRVLKTLKEDTLKANVLDKLCKEYLILNDVEQATKCVDEQLKLSQQIHYKTGIAEGFLNYGSIYRNRGDFGRALLYQKKALELMREVQSKKGEGDCYLAIGSSYSLQGNYKDALDYLFLAVKIKKVIQDKKGIADGYNNIGNSYKNQGNYAKGLSYNFQALKIREEINDVRGIAKSYNNIGLILKRQGKYDEALNAYHNGLKLQEKLKDKKGIAGLYNNMGDIYLIQKHPKEASYFYMKSLALSREENDQLGIIVAYSSLGDMYLKQKNTKEALPYELKSFLLSKELGLKKQMVNASSGAGKVYEEEKNYSKALSYYNEMLSVALESGYKSGISDAYANYASVYKKLNQFEKALQYTKLYHNFKDSLLNKENFRQMSELNMQYETDKKGKEILLLTKEQELNSKIIKQQKLVRWGLLIGVGLLFIAILSIYKRYRFKRDANLLLEKQKEEIHEKNVLITDSIDYAKTIQEVVLPNDRIMQTLLPQSFVFFQPKDIVSGDFYWIKKVEDNILCAVADCNREGVPGAFMSLLGYNMLENAIKTGCDTPSDLLNKVDAEMTARWSRSDHKGLNHTLKIALIRIDASTNQLHYAGANNSIFIIRNNVLMEFRPDDLDVGSGDKHNNHRFRPQLIHLQTGDCIYLATKGYRNLVQQIPSKKLHPSFEELLIQIHQLDAIAQRQYLEKIYLDGLLEKSEGLEDILVIGITY